MTKLTKNEEQDLIREYVSFENMIGYGSSRAVFWGPDEKVIKVAFQEEGRIQNRNEINIFRDHGYTGYFAEIESYGEFIVVMECVDDLYKRMMTDFWEFYDEDRDGDFFDYFGEDFFNEREYEIFKEVKRMFEFMTFELNNDTSDNAQIGETPDGFKFFDYGFLCSTEWRSQVGNIEPLLEDKENFELTVKELLETDLNEIVNVENIIN